MAKDELRLRKMRRSQLIEIIYALQENNQKLKTKIQSQEAMLNQRHLAMNNAGSIAEASLQLSGIFESAQKAADQYLLSITQGYGATPESLQAMQQANAAYAQQQLVQQQQPQQPQQPLPTPEMTEELRQQLAAELRDEVEQQVAQEAKAELRQQLEMQAEQAKRRQDEQANQVIYAYATQAQQKAVEVIEAAKEEAAQYAIKVVELTKQRALDEYNAVVGNAVEDADAEATNLLNLANERAQQIIEEARKEAEQEADRIIEEARQKAAEILSAASEKPLKKRRKPSQTQPSNNEATTEIAQPEDVSETETKTAVKRRRRKSPNGKPKSAETPLKQAHSTHSSSGNGALNNVSSNIVLPDENIAGEAEIEQKSNKTGARRKTPRRKPNTEASGEHAKRKNEGPKPTIQIMLEDSDDESDEQPADSKPRQGARPKKPRSSRQAG